MKQEQKDLFSELNSNYLALKDKRAISGKAKDKADALEQLKWIIQSHNSHIIQFSSLNLKDFETTAYADFIRSPYSNIEGTCSEIVDNNLKAMSEQLAELKCSVMY